MRDRKKGTEEQEIQRSQPPTISDRKLKANRENAKKSTGPKTLRGKSFSRRNALKHGLFINEVTDFEALDEDPKQYEQLINGLWNQYQPVGRAEEIQVERIALCCWRLKRAWRYENAINLAARRDFVRAELRDQEEYCNERTKEEEAVVSQLQIAKQEISDTGQLSQETKQRILAMDQRFGGMWSEVDLVVEKQIQEGYSRKKSRKLTRQQPSSVRDSDKVAMFIALIRSIRDQRWTRVIETAVGRHAIPDDGALDRILRYETTIDRFLGRSLEQLERLQRRRRGEVVPPPLSVHLL